MCSEFGVHITAESGEIQHANIMKVSQKNHIALHEHKALWISVRNEYPVANFEHVNNLMSYVTHMGYSVIGKEANMPVWRSHEVRIASQVVKISLLIDLCVKSLLNFLSNTC